MKPVNNSNSWLTFIWRGFLFLAIWVVVSDGVLSSWWIGIPAVLLATIVSTALIPPVTLVWYEVLKFIPFFFIRSFVGGADVAWRALHPRMPIAPDLIAYPLCISPGLPQVVLANVISLLPGTLSAELDQSVLKVHVLDKKKDFRVELESIEQRVARMFSVSLNLSDRGKCDEKI